MVNWLGIEDSGAVPTRVWLSRTKETGKDREEWQPLRKVDCQKLNEHAGETPVLIEGGRAAADPEFGVIRGNFVARPLRALTYGTWFVVEEYRKNESGSPDGQKARPILSPLPDDQALLVEDLYQRAIFAASSLGDGIDPILKERVPLEGTGCAADSTNYHVEVAREGGGNYRLRKSPNGWFGKSFDLQRGYGAYKVEGEEEETTLGPVRHVVFVVHGIGEAMFSRDDFTLAPSLVEHMERTRLTVQKRQIEDWRKRCDAARRNKQPEPPVPNRVEFIPIEWHDQVHSQSNDFIRSLNSVTLSTIPALRAIANDIIVDVLLYLTPNYCYDVLISVTEQINTVYGIFTKTFPDFESNGGKASLVGHSLGSVICWDLLSVLKDSKENIRGKDGHGAHLTTSRDVDNAVNINYTQFVSPVKLEETSDAATNNDESEGKHDGREGAWGPALPRKIEQVLKFTPEFTIFLGSPIGLFLTLRGAHGLFDSMRENDDALPSPFTLPCRSTYNIFSPSDPVAYRIEPLLLPLDTPKADIPEPAYLTRLGEDVRFHVKAMQLGDEISKVFTNKRGSVSSFFTSITEQAQSALSQIEASTLLSSRITMMEPSSSNKRSKGSNEDDKNHIRFPLGGRSGRVDFQIQPRVIESEYISAVTAHSSYFQNTDVIDFIIDLVHREEEIIDLTTDDHVVGSIDCNKTN